MKMKRCPKCGEEIPEGMQFCLHCMERIEGTVEIRQTYHTNRWLWPVILLCAAVLAVGGFLLLRRQQTAPEHSGIVLMTEEPLRTDMPENTEAALPASTSASADTMLSQAETELPHSESSRQRESSSAEKPVQDAQQGQKQDPAASPAETPQEKKQDSAVREQESTQEQSRASEQSRAAESSAPDTPVMPETEPPAELPAEPEDSFETVFRERLSHYGGSRILADTLTFDGDACQFDVKISLAQIAADLTVSSDRTAYTLKLDTSRYDLTVLSPVEDIIKEINALALDYRYPLGYSFDVKVINSAVQHPDEECTFTLDGMKWILSTERSGDAQPLSIRCEPD